MKSGKSGILFHIRESPNEEYIKNPEENRPTNMQGRGNTQKKWKWGGSAKRKTMLFVLKATGKILREKEQVA